MYVLCRVCSIIHWILEQIPGLIDGAEEPLLASPNIKKIYEYTYKYKYILQIIYIIRCSVVWCPKNNQNLAKKTSLSRLEYGTRYIQYYGRTKENTVKLSMLPLSYDHNPFTVWPTKHKHSTWPEVEHLGLGSMMDNFAIFFNISRNNLTIYFLLALGCNRLGNYVTMY